MTRKDNRRRIKVNPIKEQHEFRVLVFSFTKMRSAILILCPPHIVLTHRNTLRKSLKLFYNCQLSFFFGKIYKKLTASLKNRNLPLFSWCWHAMKIQRAALIPISFSSHQSTWSLYEQVVTRTCDRRLCINNTLWGMNVMCFGIVFVGKSNLELDVVYFVH